jgi:hypothetical protein
MAGEIIREMRVFSVGIGNHKVHEHPAGNNNNPADHDRKLPPPV